MSAADRRVLVTGASGFVGRHVVRELLSRGWAVDALTRDRGKAFSGATTVVGDLEDFGAFPRWTEGRAAVVHLGANIPASYTDSSQADACVRTNGIATLRLAEAALAGGVERFVYVSSGNVFAPDVTAPVEESPLYPVAYATYYLASKVLGETYVEHLRRARGLGAVTLRITSTYGLGMSEKSVVAAFMRAAARGGALEVRDGGRATYDLVFVEDIARLIGSALDGGEPGVYNAGGGRSTTVGELAQAVASLYADRGASVAIAPASGAAPAGFPALSVAKANRVFGYAPVSVAEGLALFREQLEG